MMAKDFMMILILVCMIVMMKTKTKKKKNQKDEELIDNATVDETNELNDLENLDDDLKFHQEMLDIEREKNYKEILTIEIDDIIQGGRTSNPVLYLSYMKENLVFLNQALVINVIQDYVNLHNVIQ